MGHDRKWYTEQLEDVCRKHFWVVDELENFHPEPVSKKPSLIESDEGGVE